MRNHRVLLALAEVGSTADTLRAVDDLRRDHKVLRRDLLAQRANGRESQHSANAQVLQCRDVRRRRDMRRRNRMLQPVAGKERDQRARIRASDADGRRRIAPRLHECAQPTVLGFTESMISIPSSLYRPDPPMTPTRIGAPSHSAFGSICAMLTVRSGPAFLRWRRGGPAFVA